jgi:hypothetical protein
MTSYFCDVISSPELWISSPPDLQYDVISSPVYEYPHKIYDVSVKRRWQKLARGDFVFLSTLQALHSRLSSGEAWWSTVKLHLFSSLSSLSWWHKHVSPFAMSAFSNLKKKKTFSSGLGSKKSSTLFINRTPFCSPVWYLDHYSNVLFNSKSNVIVTLSEHVDGNFQARCGQRLQSTNHVVLRATISPSRK